MWNAPLPIFCRLLDTGKMQCDFLQSNTQIESRNHCSPSTFNTVFCLMHTVGFQVKSMSLEPWSISSPPIGGCKLIIRTIHLVIQNIFLLISNIKPSKTHLSVYGKGARRLQKGGLCVLLAWNTLISVNQWIGSPAYIFSVEAMGTFYLDVGWQEMSVVIVTIMWVAVSLAFLEYSFVVWNTVNLQKPLPGGFSIRTINRLKKLQFDHV